MTVPSRPGRTAQPPVDDRSVPQLVSVGLALGLLALGVLLQRVGLVVLAVPFALMVLVPVRVGPVRLRPRVDRATPRGPLLEVPLTAEKSPSRGPELSVVSLDAPGVRDAMHVLAPDRAASAGTPTPVARFLLPVSGRAAIGRIAVRQLGPDALHQGPWTAAVDVRSRAWPQVSVRRTPAPVARRLARTPGSHRARMAGSGTDPKDIRPLTPSDSLRDVDWRATARSTRAAPDQGGELLVRERHAEQQSPVRLVIDTGDDLAWNPITWYHSRQRTVADPSLLSEARSAAIALATVHVRAGDRVGLSELNDGGTPVRAATGNRQLDRIRSHVADLGAARYRRPWKRITSPPQPGSLVYVLSAFLDPLAAERSLQWSAHGHRVIAVDVGRTLDQLTPGRLQQLTGHRWRWVERWLRHADDPRLTAAQALTCRLVLAGRRSHLLELERAGIEVLTWSTPDAAALTLVELDRRRLRSRRTVA